MVTKQEVVGNWNSLVGAVKKEYGQLTDDELAQVDGSIDQLIGLVQRKTGQAREKIAAFILDCSESCEEAMDNASFYTAAATEKVREGYDALSKQARSSYDASVKTVSRHPLESVGTAFGVGLVAGLLIGLSFGAQRERELGWRGRWMR